MKTNETISAVNEDAIKQPANKFLGLLNALPFKFFNKNATVSILRLEGVIGKIGMGREGLTIDSLREQIEQAFKPKKLLAVCLVINSPGGKPVQAELISTYIRTLADERAVPVYSFVEDVAASGGYWLACAGDEIYASRSSIIGSIGVISSGFGLHKTLEKFGIERRVYTQGSNKSVLDPFSPEKKEDVKIIKNLQEQVYQHFVDYVKLRRKNSLTQSDKILFSGEFWAGLSALDFGLIDGIEDVYVFIKKKFGANVEIKHIKGKVGWIRRYLTIDIIEGVKQQLISGFWEYISRK